MKLLTAPIIKALDANPLYSHDGEGDNAKVICKFFGGGRFTFLVTEGSRIAGGPASTDWTFFGWCVSNLGPNEDEWGYITLSQLQEMRFPPFGLKVERDMYSCPILKKTIKEMLK